MKSKKLEFSIIDKTDDRHIMSAYLALGCCIFGGSVIGADFTVEDTIGKEHEILKSLGLFDKGTKNRTTKRKIVKTEKHRRYNNIRMKDIETKETIRVFKDVEELSQFLDVSVSRAYQVLKNRERRNGYIYVSGSKDKETQQS